MEIVWILAAVGGYFLFGAVAIGDRLLLTKTVKDPLAYVFSIGVAALAGLALIPLVDTWPTQQGFLLAALAGVIFLLGLWPLMSALRLSDASRVFPANGGLVTILTFLLAVWLLGERLSGTALLAFLLLLVGYVFLTLTGKWRNMLSDILDWHIILSAALIAISLVIRRSVFSTEPFLGAWIAVAIGMGITALLLLLLPHTLERIKIALREGKNHHLGMVLVNQAGGALAAFLQSLAISLGPVALVQAMQGVQYVFILLFALILTHRFPHLLKENFADGALARKIGGILAVSIGVGFLVFV